MVVTNGVLFLPLEIGTLEIIAEILNAGGEALLVKVKSVADEDAAGVLRLFPCFESALLMVPWTEAFVKEVALVPTIVELGLERTVFPVTKDTFRGSEVIRLALLEFPNPSPLSELESDKAMFATTALLGRGFFIVLLTDTEHIRADTVTKLKIVWVVVRPEDVRETN